MAHKHLSHDEIRSRVPRRSGIFLFITNQIQYLVILPVVAFIFTFELEFWVSLLLSLLSALAMVAFWTALNLDLPSQAQSHPHHKNWGKLKQFLALFTPVIQDRPAWVISAIAWLILSLSTFFTLSHLSSPLYAGTKLRLPVEMFWLSYLPVVMWVSYRSYHHISEWFTLFVLGSALFYVVIFLINKNGEMNTNEVIKLFILLGWFIFLAGIIHYLLRRIANFRGQAQLIQSVTERLRDDRRYTEAFDIRPLQSTPDVYLNEIAALIGKMLLFDRVFILVRHTEKDMLLMKGRYGIDAPWPEVGWSIKNQPSITGWVAQHKTAHLCHDTEKCSLFFNPSRAYPCRSEVAVPILVDGECVGVIDVESVYKHAFGHSDVRLLWQIANSIGAALSYERLLAKEIKAVYELIEQASDILVNSSNLDDALKKVTQNIRGLFEADLVVLYKHTVSTCVPLPGRITDGVALHPDQLGNTIRKDSRLNQLIQQPQTLYIQPNVENDPLLLGSEDGRYTETEAREVGTSHRFVKRELIKSMIYVKLGLGKDIVGSLFLNYRRRIDFSQRKIDSLKAFANVLTMGLILKRQLERAVGPLAGNVPLAHSTAEAAFESVSRDFDDIDWKSIKKNAATSSFMKQVDDYRSKLDKLRLEWTNLILIEQIHLRHSSMIEPITHLESKLRSMFPFISFIWDSREFIDIPTDQLGEMIYKLIAEGVSNALVHARADHIAVNCEKRLESIGIKIVNNGLPIDTTQASKINLLMHTPYSFNPTEKHTGIIAILLDARRWFGAEWGFRSTVQGTEMTVLIPINPYRPVEEEIIDEN